MSIDHAFSMVAERRSPATVYRASPYASRRGSAPVPSVMRSPPHDGSGLASYGCLAQSMSNRSRLITLSQAATKSRTNFSFASSHA